MSQAEEAIIQQDAGSLADRWAKNAFLSVVKYLPDGHLTVTENGVLIGTFGKEESDLHAEVNILHVRAYRKLLLGGSVASGETFMEGLWNSPDVTNVIRVFARNLPVLDCWEARFKWLMWPINKVQHFANRNSVTQARKNIQAHYDLGNDLYTEFLDKSMMYSAAIYPHSEATLAEAQQTKLQTICEKLQLTPEDHLIEIGTGWGGLAVYAAKNFGCKVTTTTISDEQYAWAEEWVAKEGLQDKVTLLKKDYRVLTGKYDKLVSIEMIEAVGKEYLPSFFKKCDELLKPKGLMVLQAITIDDCRYDSYSKNVDFIQKYIFPGGFLPSQFVLNKCVKKYTDMSIRDLHDIGLDYAQTLLHWHEEFLDNMENLKQKGYDERFARMWQFYLNYCEGGFRERTISTVQLVLGKSAHINDLEFR